MMWAWVLSIGTIIIGLCFFWFRNNHRVLYGLVEIVASFAIMYLNYFPHGHGGILLTAGNPVPPPFPVLDAMIVKSVPFFVSLYAFVRGCDNVVNGLRE